MYQRASMSSGGGTSQVTNAIGFRIATNGTWTTQIDLNKTYVITCIGASQYESRTNVFTIINGVLTHNYAGNASSADSVLNQSSISGTTLTMKSTSSLVYYGALTELS